LFILPWLDTSRVRSAFFRPVYKWIFWFLVIDCFLLGYVGAHKPEGFYVILGRICTIYFYLHFYILIPLIGIFERPRPLPASIAEAVLKKPPATSSPAGAAMGRH
jgi:ubiquinol-cytochrome c reductase cytochrome b/c1 subunit